MVFRLRALYSLLLLKIGVTLRATNALLDEREIVALIKNVEPAYKNKCDSILRGRNESFSQSWQDWILFHNFFHHKRHWGTGFYVDFGTNDPEYISNTFFFDKCLGWKGLCIEMQEKYHAAIRAKRSCTLVPRCVLGVAANVSFSGGDGSASVRSDKEGEHISCLGVQDVFERYNFPKRFDFLSVDIEASEPSVLRCWDFKVVTPKTVLIETNKHQQTLVDLFFHRRGYANVETVLAPDADRSSPAAGGIPWLDNIYIHSRAPIIIHPHGWHEWPGPAHENPWVCPM